MKQTPFKKAIFLWFLFLPLSMINAMLRELLFNPLIGKAISLPLSGIILSALIFICSYYLFPRKPNTYIFAVQLGGIWLVSTFLFDSLINALTHRTKDEVLATYDVTTGNLWILVLISVALTPLIVTKLRNRKTQNKRIKK